MEIYGQNFFSAIYVIRVNKIKTASSKIRQSNEMNQGTQWY